MIPKKNIDDLIFKHSNLEKELSSGNLDKKLFAAKSKEYSDLNEIILDAKGYISFENEKKDLEKIINDKESDNEIKLMAEQELDELKLNHEKSEKRLKFFLLPKDEADKKNAIIEIRAGRRIRENLFGEIYLRCYSVHKKMELRINLIIEK